jgi:hypothetical protein
LGEEVLVFMIFLFCSPSFPSNSTQQVLRHIHAYEWPVLDF